MSVGFVMLVHTGLIRVAQVARHLATDGSPVVIHVDARVPDDQMALLTAAVRDLNHVSFARRRACHWGQWSIVAATQDAARQLLDEHPTVGHVQLLSGACLPLKPLTRLRRFLSRSPDTDFIESVTTADVPWTLGGLEAERFSLYFPFSWKSQRRFFDWSVGIQRRLRMRRKPPLGVVPHLGSQWWCLTRQTLLAILEDPDRRRFDRYFRQVWIPDESYFQTLARRHARHIECRSLTLSRFGVEGRPHTYYDDHLEVLRRSDSYFARKVWRGADRLYRNFLGDGALRSLRAAPDPGKVDRMFRRAATRRTTGRVGLLTSGRYPRNKQALETSDPYSVYQGVAEVITDFEGWFASISGAEVHGRLMHPAGAEFAGRTEVTRGGLAAQAALRDYDPAGFLRNLVWSGQGTRQAFCYQPEDSSQAWSLLCQDPNACVTMVLGAWALPLANSAMPFDELRRNAAWLQKRERMQLEVLKGAPAGARARIWSLADFLGEPEKSAQLLLDDVLPLGVQTAQAAPRFQDPGELVPFLQALRNSGMSPYLAGDVVLPPAPETEVISPVRRAARL